MREALCQQEICTACGACMNSCSQNAISFKTDRDGFYYADIDEAVCINCGACARVCPQLNLPENNHYQEPQCFACQADDVIRWNSSSGGMFTVLASYVLSKGGHVFGSAYDEQLLPCVIEITSTVDLSKLQKSKYTQSYPGFAYRRVKELLSQGETVLYCSVPCHIGGLVSYLGKDYDNLYLTDVMCSGNAPVGLYKDYLRELEEENGHHITGIDFRNKANGWSCGHSTLYFEDGSEKNQPYDVFMRAFITGGMRAHMCNECNYAEFPRFGDLTLGDFWNLEKYDKSLVDEKGTSLVTVNSEKGRSLFDAAVNNIPLKLCVPVDFSFTRGSNWFTKSRPVKPEAEHLYALRRSGHGASDSLRRLLERKYDICALGNWSGFNYGAHLTHYAFYRVLTDLGYDVLMLEKPDEPPFRPLTTPKLFRENPYPPFALSRLYPSLKDMRQLMRCCDTYISGSDMLWNYKMFGHGMEFYLMSFVDREKNKISYATSFGQEEKDIPQSHLNLMGALMNRLDHVSTREDFGVKIAREKFGVEAEHVLDPVFLCDIRHYEELIRNSRLAMEKDYIFCYVIHPRKNTFAFIDALSAQMGLEVVCVDDALKMDAAKRENYRYIENVKVEDWLALLFHSSFVIADSFHAYAFALIFGKQVIPVYPVESWSSRAESLSNVFHLPNPLIIREDGRGKEKYSSDDVIAIRQEYAIDYTTVNLQIKDEVSRCLRWLADAISNPPAVRKLNNEELLLELEIDNMIQLRSQRKETEELRKEVDEFRKLKTAQSVQQQLTNKTLMQRIFPLNELPGKVVRKIKRTIKGQ